MKDHFTGESIPSQFHNYSSFSPASGGRSAFKPIRPRRYPGPTHVSSERPGGNHKSDSFEATSEAVCSVRLRTAIVRAKQRHLFIVADPVDSENPVAVANHNTLPSGPALTVESRLNAVNELDEPDVGIDAFDPTLPVHPCSMQHGMAVSHVDEALPNWAPLERTTDRVFLMLLTGDLYRLRAESVAETLGMSCTTLRRRLRHDRTSYQFLLDRARQYRCEIRLKERWLPGKCLADELGYLEINSFYRAFRRWTGLSYSEYRLQYE
ncbi:MAG: AraC family transcriptional regulator [Pseudomonadota bacterium]